MKFTLPQKISTLKDVKEYLNNLHEHGLAYCPEDDATKITFAVTDPPTDADKVRMNELMEMVFTVCNSILDGQKLDPTYYLLNIKKRFSVKDKTGKGGLVVVNGNDLLDFDDLNENEEFIEWCESFPDEGDTFYGRTLDVTCMQP